MNNKVIQHIDIIDQNYFSWKLFLIIFIWIVTIILIIFIFTLQKSTRNKCKATDNKYSLESISSSIGQVLFSGEEINIGKNSVVYKANLNKDTIILKVYKQTNKLIWKNEMTLLNSIKHESIMKYA